MKKPSPSRRRRPEAEKFRLAITRLRGENGWTQGELAARLAISKRTLSHWECGHWLPPFKQRLHLVMQLDSMPSHVVLEVADGLGVSANPVVAPLLKRHVDALYGPDEDEAPEAPPAPPPLPPRPRPSPEQLRDALDVVVRDAADGLNVLANDLRAAIDRALATSDALGGTLEDTRAAVAVRVKAKAPSIP